MNNFAQSSSCTLIRTAQLDFSKNENNLSKTTCRKCERESHQNGSTHQKVA